MELLILVAIIAVIVISQKKSEAKAVAKRKMAQQPVQQPEPVTGKERFNLIYDKSLNQLYDMPSSKVLMPSWWFNEELQKQSYLHISNHMNTQNHVIPNEFVISVLFEQQNDSLSTLAYLVEQNGGDFRSQCAAMYLLAVESWKALSYEEQENYKAIVRVNNLINEPS